MDRYVDRRTTTPRRRRRSRSRSILPVVLIVIALVAAAGFGLFRLFMEDLRYSKKRTDLTQYLGIPEEEMVIEPEVSRYPYGAGDLYLLCTDGVWNCSNEEVLRDLFLHAMQRRVSRQLIIDSLRQTSDKKQSP